jgi:hypothetical protein
MSKSHNAKRFLAACRRGATVDEMDRLLADVRLDYQIKRDARALLKLASKIADGEQPPSPAVDEVAALVERARYLMETA